MSPTTATPLAADDIQSVVLRDPTGGHVLHVVMNFSDGGKGRHALWRMASAFPITPASVCKASSPTVQISLGLTYRGLEKLNVPPQLLRPFLALAPAFAASAPLRAAEQLGDTGPSAPNLWEIGFGLDTAHAVLTLHSNDLQELQQAWADLCGLSPLPPAPARAQPVLLHPLWGQRWGTRQNQRVHFGFRDGLSKACIKGWRGPDQAAGAPLHEPGEFLLGHRNNHGYNTWVLASSAKDVRTFFRNGSFGVLRKIEQDVAAFESWITKQAQALVTLQNAGRLPAGAPALGADVGAWKNYLKAKLCGRWPSGELLSPTAPHVAAGNVHADLNHRADPNGIACPFGSHIRRMNPRETSTNRSGVVHIRQRTLLRRGRPYGIPSEAEPEPPEQGLLGLFFCASIEDQFEHLLGQWAERRPLGVADAGTAKDPLIGQHDNPHTTFDIPLPSGESLILSDFQAFVRTRGTVYAFHPSLSALQLLLNNGDFLDELDEDLDA